MNQISNKDELRRIIARYVRGQASEAEIIFLKQYYDQFSNHSKKLEHLSDSERDRLKKDMFGVIDGQINSSGQKRIYPLWILRTAAVLVLAIACGIGVWISPFEFKAEPETKLLPGEITRTSSMTFTAEEEVLHHYLPDGSYVVLEPGSEITYGSGFTDSIRQVELTGEAFFDIEHDANAPFIVTSNGVTTRVLGTAFRISTFKQTHEFSIAVTRGKVEVSNHDQQLGILERNDHMTLDLETNEITKVRMQDQETAEMGPVEYIMDDISLGSAVSIISQRWDCTFSVDNQDLYGCEFTTSFLPTDDLEALVAVICAVIGADYSIRDNVVTLTGTGCK